MLKSIALLLLDSLLILPASNRLSIIVEIRLTAKYSYQILKISSSSSGYMYHLQIQKIQKYCNTKQQVPNRKKRENDLLLLT